MNGEAPKSEDEPPKLDDEPPKMNADVSAKYPISAGLMLRPGYSIWSDDGSVQLALSDGNLRLSYKLKTLWQTRTSGKQVFGACMGTDGNFVLYDDKRGILWQSNTKSSSQSCRVIVQNDGNMAIYDEGNNRIWQTETKKF